MPGNNDGRRRAFLRHEKSSRKWENRSNKELREIYWELKAQHKYKRQFVAFCDFLQKKGKFEEVIK